MRGRYTFHRVRETDRRGTRVGFDDDDAAAGRSLKVVLSFFPSSETFYAPSFRHLLSDEDEDDQGKVSAAYRRAWIINLDDLLPIIGQPVLLCDRKYRDDASFKGVVRNKR